MLVREFGNYVSIVMGDGSMPWMVTKGEAERLWIALGEVLGMEKRSPHLCLNSNMSNGEARGDE